MGFRTLGITLGLAIILAGCSELRRGPTLGGASIERSISTTAPSSSESLRQIASELSYLDSEIADLMDSIEAIRCKRTAAAVAQDIYVAIQEEVVGFAFHYAEDKVAEAIAQRLDPVLLPYMRHAGIIAKAASIVCSIERIRREIGQGVLKLEQATQLTRSIDFISAQLLSMIQREQDNALQTAMEAELRDAALRELRCEKARFEEDVSEYARRLKQIRNEQ